MLVKLATNPNLRMRALAMTPKYQVQLSRPIFAGQPGVKTAQQMTDDWLATAGKQGRPMSPHLSVYKWSIPMTMSAFNRIFAFALTFAFIGLPLLDIWTGDAVAAIAEFGTTMRASGAVGTGAIMVLKSSLLFPFFYHTFVGMRHWSWDIFAVGIKDMNTLYQTGYIAIAAALALTGTLIFFLNFRENF